MPSRPRSKRGEGLTVKRLEAALIAPRTPQEQARLRAGPWRHLRGTGIDYLLVDEAHRYKNLRTRPTSRAALAGPSAPTTST